MQSLRGIPTTIYGDGSQSRSFCYVDDLVDGLIRLMNSDDGTTGPINIGSPTEFTILELAEKISELTGSELTLEYQELPGDDPIQRQPDIAIARAGAKAGDSPDPHCAPLRFWPNIIPV